MSRAPPGIDEMAAELEWASRIERRSSPACPTSATGAPDVMRGEEVQLLGAVAAGLIGPDAMVCHPGTHNKWVAAAARAASTISAR